MCWRTEAAAPSTNVPSPTQWLTLLWKVKVGHRTVNQHHAEETCFEKVLFCVRRCHCDQQQVLTDVHLPLTLSHPARNPSLVSTQESTRCHPGDVPSPFSLFLTPLTAKTAFYVPPGFPGYRRYMLVFCGGRGDAGRGAVSPSKGHPRDGGPPAALQLPHRRHQICP